MTETCQHNSRCDDHLDMEYLATLRNIKPYITCIMNNHYIELIRVWLEKLSDIHTQDDKALRNVYLVELGKQIVSGVFVEPFIDPPDEGALPPFKNCWRFAKDKLQNINTNEITDAWTQSHPNNVSVQAMSDLTNKSSSQTVTDETAVDTNIDKKRFADNSVANNNFYAKCATPEVSRSQKNNSNDKPRDVRRRLDIDQEYPNSIFRSSKPSKKKKPKNKKHLNIHTIQHNKISEDLDGFPTGFSPRRLETPIREVRVYSPIRKRKVNEKKFNETDDSSWLDLTDCSTHMTALCSGDADITPRTYEKDEADQITEIYESKITELIKIIRELREENANLCKKVDKYEQDLRNTKTKSGLHSLTNEVDSLKAQLQELINIKLSLQNSHFGVNSEWQNTVSSLHKKLAVLQRKHNELKAENNDLVRKLEEQELEKRQELMLQKKKLSDFNNKENDMLKQIHAKAITELESKYMLKMTNQDTDFRKRLEDLKDSYEERFNSLKEDYDARVNLLKDDCESRINSVSLDYEKALSHKDAEIDRLEHMLQEQCVRMQEEVHLIRSQIESNMSSNNDTNLEKITFLQKCIIKMEKLYQKAEKENMKQMTKLKRELEFRDKSNQLALTTQRADLLSLTVNGKQNEIDLVVNRLEEYYKKKLIEYQQKAMEEKRQDNKLIADLKEQLGKLTNEY